MRVGWVCSCRAAWKLPGLGGGHGLIFTGAGVCDVVPVKNEPHGRRAKSLKRFLEWHPFLFHIMYAQIIGIRLLC